MFNRLKITLALLPVVSLMLIGTYVYSLWTEGRQRSAEVPVEASGLMMRDLLAYHKKRGGFPGNLKALEGVVWDKKRSREFSLDNRALIHRNYFYLYTRISPHKFTLWAVPMGQVRDEAATFFLTATTGGHRTWKGPALPPDSVKGIKANPSEIELGTLGLIEQPRVVTQERRR